MLLWVHLSLPSAIASVIAGLTGVTGLMGGADNRSSTCRTAPKVSDRLCFKL